MSHGNKKIIPAMGMIALIAVMICFVRPVLTAQFEAYMEAEKDKQTGSGVLQEEGQSGSAEVQEETDQSGSVEVQEETGQSGSAEVQEETGQSGSIEVREETDQSESVEEEQSANVGQQEESESSKAVQQAVDWSEIRTETTVKEEKNHENSKPEVPGYRFRSRKHLTDHYKKHGIEMGFDSAQGYEKAAAAVVQNPDALHKIEAEDGDDVYYLQATNEFVIVSTDGYIRTYFKPNSGIKYFNRQ